MPQPPIPDPTIEDLRHLDDILDAVEQAGEEVDALRQPASMREVETVPTIVEVVPRELEENPRQGRLA